MGLNRSIADLGIVLGPLTMDCCWRLLTIAPRFGFPRHRLDLRGFVVVGISEVRQYRPILTL